MNNEISRRNNLVDQLTTKHLDFHGRRITNAQDAQADQDYLTLGQAKKIFAQEPATTAAVSNAVDVETYSLSFSGTLSISSDICPRREITADGRAKNVKLTLKTAGNTGSVIVEIYQSTTLWMTLTLPSGLSVEATSGQISSAANLVKGGYWRVDIISVSGPTFPGADMVITITT